MYTPTHPPHIDGQSSPANGCDRLPPAGTRSRIPTAASAPTHRRCVRPLRPPHMPTGPAGPPGDLLQALERVCPLAPSCPVPVPVSHPLYDPCHGGHGGERWFAGPRSGSEWQRGGEPGNPLTAAGRPADRAAARGAAGAGAAVVRARVPRRRHRPGDGPVAVHARAHRGARPSASPLVLASSGRDPSPSLSDPGPRQGPPSVCPKPRPKTAATGGGDVRR